MYVHNQMKTAREDTEEKLFLILSKNPHYTTMLKVRIRICFDIPP